LQEIKLSCKKGAQRKFAWPRWPGTPSIDFAEDCFEQAGGSGEMQFDKWLSGITSTMGPEEDLDGNQ
jgi:hypothetical protein